MSKKLVIKKKPDLISTTPTANSYVGLSQLQLLEKVSLLHNQLLKINNYLAQLHRLAVYDYNYNDTDSVEISLPENHKGFLLDSVIKYRGEWNPDTNTPILLADDPLKIGWAYIANADGYMPSGAVEVKRGDFILYDSEGVLFNLSDWTNGRVLEQLNKKLPKDGSEPMEGNLNMGGNEIANVDNIQFERGSSVGSLGDNDFTINLNNGNTFTFSENGLDMFSRKLTEVAKGVNSKDGANMENINDIESDVDDLETEIGNIKNGTTIVKKAEQDQLGNVINTTYETKAVVSGISTLISSLDLSKLNKEFTSLIEEVSLSLSDVFVVDKGSGARKVSLGTIASYLSTQELQLFTIVGELPNENQNPNTIYLLTTENEEGQNQLLEYIWIANQERWELIGSLEVDLSNYYTKTEANELFNNKVDKVEGKQLSTNDYTNTDKQSVEKIPTIEQDILDLESDKVDKNNAITAGTKTKITYDSKGLVTSGADLTEADIPTLSASKITQSTTARFVSDTEKSTWNGKVTSNSAITGATKTKITYDSKGLVTSGADLEATDIPQLPPSKITQDANNRFTTDAEKSIWSGKQNALTAGDGISISGNVISADSGLTVETWSTATKTLALSDANKLILCSYTDNQTIIIPTKADVAFPIGTMITFLLTSTYKVTFLGQTVVTLTSIDGLVELATQFGMASLIKTDTNTWQLVGALE